MLCLADYSPDYIEQNLRNQMKVSRPSRFIAALLVLISMLSMQLAMAGYDCPTFNIATPELMAMDAGDGPAMTGCIGHDQLQPGLCHAHDQNGKQSLDKPASPHVSAFLPATLTLIPRHIVPAGNDADRQTSTVLLTRASAPPLSIRNCCFRI
jgi:hypothetical protein